VFLEIKDEEVLNHFVLFFLFFHYIRNTLMPKISGFGRETVFNQEGCLSPDLFG